MMWVIAPGGLETFFEAVGRPRIAGEPAPEPFARPADVVDIERRLGMNDTVALSFAKGSARMPKADIGDAEIYYEEAGEGPPLMLVPGLGGGGAFWRHQVEAFRGHFRVVIHDHRGAGQEHPFADHPTRSTRWRPTRSSSWTRWTSKRPITSAIRPAVRSARPSPRTPATG